MKPLCYELLQGQLTNSPPASGVPQGSLTNGLPVSINLIPLPFADGKFPYLSGWGAPMGTVNPGGIQRFSPDSIPGLFVATVAATGGLIDVINVPGGVDTTIAVSPNSLTASNDIGPIPVPTAAQPTPIDPPPPFPNKDSTVFIPPDSARVLVGCGTAPNGNPITREQYWMRHGDSLCLAGGEARTVSYTVTSGREETSSDSNTVATSLGTSVSAGWGPISASISASISTNSTQFRQVTVSNQTTSYVSSVITNNFKEPVAFLRWQLVDVITVFDKTSRLPISSLSQGQSPVLVMGPYWIAATPEPHDQQRLEARRAGVFEYSASRLP